MVIPLPDSGFCATSTPALELLQDGTGEALLARSTKGPAIRGVSEKANEVGVEGVNHAVNAVGVRGSADAAIGVAGTSSSGNGVLGTSAEGEGVVGQSNHGNGVVGRSDQANGVLGLANSREASGVFGSNSNGSQGNGVTGLSRAGFGVLGETDAEFGGGDEHPRVAGVGGLNAAGDGALGVSWHAPSAGVHGINRSERSAGAHGVRGQGAVGVGGEGGRIGVIGTGSSFGVIGRAGEPPAGQWPDPNPVAAVAGQSLDARPGVLATSQGFVSRGLQAVASGSLSQGVNSSATGQWSIGVQGSGDHAGVNGTASGQLALDAGVVGSCSSTSAFMGGVTGKGRGLGYGVGGVAENDGPGLFGMTSGNGAALVAHCAPNPTGNIGGPFMWAGSFIGKVNVTGPVHKSGGGFRIDHPLEPATRYLDHSFVESDQRKNVYDGMVELGADGSAVVALPRWCEVLNKEFRYQLTAIGAPAPELHISREVQAGQFEIAGGQPGQRVSWQLTGQRDDLWSRANPMIPELEKDEVERGHYRHPELYDLPWRQSVDCALYGDPLEAMEARRAAEQERPRP